MFFAGNNGTGPSNGPPPQAALFVLKARGKCADKNVDVKILREDLPCRIAVSLPQVSSWQCSPNKCRN
jgi:hypothetical protein